MKLSRSGEAYSSLASFLSCGVRTPIILAAASVGVSFAQKAA